MSDEHNDEIPRVNFDPNEENENELENLEVEQARKIISKFNYDDIHRHEKDELIVMEKYLAEEIKKADETEKRKIALQKELNEKELLIG
jgi:hypothetical protein